MSYPSHLSYWPYPSWCLFPRKARWIRVAIVVAFVSAGVAQAAGHHASGADAATTPTVGEESPQTPETRVVPPFFFGLQMHSLLSTEENHTRAAEAAAALGAMFVRDECFWHEVEKTQGHYKIPTLALRNLQTNQRLGLDTVLILNYANTLYDGGAAPTSPEALAAFGGYCRFMAAHLKDLCRHFEIWNEPNTDGFWRPHKDPSAYARLLAIALREVKQGNPDAIVLGGALSGIDAEFMTAVAAETDCAEMDVLSIHPYCTPRSPGQAGIFPRMDSLRRAVFPDARKLRPIWVTEIGYPTNEQGGVSERRQAEVLAQTYLLGATRPELQGIVWYWMGPDGPDALWAEDRFGLFRPEFKGRKPSAYPFDILAHALAGATMNTKVEPLKEFGKEVPGSYVLRARDPQGRYLTALYVEEGERTIALNGVSAVEVISLNGALPRILASWERGGPVLTVTPMPVLLRSASAPQIEEWHWGPMVLPAGGKDSPTRIARGSHLDLPFGQGEHTALPGAGARWVAASNGSVEIEADPSAVPWSAEPVVVDDARQHQDILPRDSGSPAFPLGQPYTPFGPDRSREGERNTAGSSGIRVRVAPDAQPQTAPLVVYWTPANAQRPVARIVHPLEVVDPVSIVVRPARDPLKGPSVEIGVDNKDRVPVDATVRAQVEGQPAKSWRLTALPSGSEAVPFFLIEYLPAPDAVLECNTEVVTSSGVKISGRNFLSWMTSPQVTTSLVIDGDLSDWPAGLAPIHLGAKNQIVAERDPWKGIADASARVWTAWDDQWFYIGAELVDDLHVEEATGFTVYNNDGLEVYFDTDRERGRTRETYGDHQFQYGLFPSQGQDVLYEFHQVNGPSPGGRIKINRAPHPAQRYPGTPGPPQPTMILEAAIPLKELQLTPRPGLEIGFSVALNDDDSPGVVNPFSQDLQMQWSRQRNAWQRPAAFVSLWLADPLPKR